MIVEALVNLFTVVIKLLAVPFNILPDTPEALVNAMDYFMDMIFNNLTLKNVALIAIVIWTVEHGYSLLIWIIHKLPFSIT